MMEGEDAVVAGANTANATLPGDGDAVTQPQLNDVGNIQQQLLAVQNQNLTVMSALAKLLSERQVPDPHAALVKNLKVPVGTYNMSLSEFRSFKKDVQDYNTLSGYSEAQVVTQLRLHCDAELKRAIDTNISNWNTLSINEAVKKIGEIVNHVSNPAVYRKQFDDMNQKVSELLENI